MSSTDTVRVAVRVRPFNRREVDLKSKLVIQMEGNRTVITNPENGKANDFTFDFSYWSHDRFVDDEHGVLRKDSPDSRYASQQDVFNDVGVDILNNAFNGYNCSLFAYGQTGSGKSYSMVGHGANKGIIPQICEQMFVRTSSNSDPNVQYQITVSMLEIYNEQIRDLLTTKAAKGGLKLRSKLGIGNYVDGLSVQPVRSYAEVSAAMDEGTKNRTVASTKMNNSSSRAHTVFTIHFTTFSQQSAGVRMETTAKINLVDLAGSERADSTGATGDRLKEGSAINQSLSALGNVISALAEVSQGKKKVFVPYRNSVLTRLLQDALGGNSKTIMIASLSPADDSYDETLSTLRYADRAKQIKNAVVKNENPTDRMIIELREENERLNKMLKENGVSRKGSGGSDDGESARLQAQLEEQMQDNQRLMEDMQKTWEQRLKEALDRQTHASEEEHGGALSVANANASHLPHVINLHEDPQLSECVVYVFKPGVTRIGCTGASQKQDVVLSGLNIKKEHLLANNEDNVVTLTPLDNSKTFVNGELITDATEVHHGDRIIIGNNFVFRFEDPNTSAEELKELEARGHITWDKAMEEFTTRQGLRLQQDVNRVSKLEQEEAEKRRELEEKLRAMEEQVKAEREKAARALAEQREIYESLGGADQEKLRTVEAEFARKTQVLNAELQKKKEQSQRIIEEQLRQKRENRKIESELAALLPLLNEANSIAEELQLPVKLEARLTVTTPRALFSPGSSAALDISIRVMNTHDDSVWTWSASKFQNRLFVMRELYQDLATNGPRYIEPSQDPFWDPPEPVEIGKAYVFLKPLSNLVEIQQDFQVVDHKGTDQGTLHVEIQPQGMNGEDLDYVQDSSAIIGRPFRFRLSIPSAQGLPLSLANDVFVSFDFLDRCYETKHYPSKSSDPRFDYVAIFDLSPVTDEFRRYLLSESMVFSVKGSTDAQSKAAAIAATAITPVVNAGPICEQCEEQAAGVDCIDCGRALCESCFALLHRSAKKQNHNAVLIPPPISVGHEQQQWHEQAQFHNWQTQPFLHSGTNDSSAVSGVEGDDVEQNRASTLCGQCEEQLAVVTCVECSKLYCADCNALLHKSAKRQTHTRHSLTFAATPAPTRNTDAPTCSQCEEQPAVLLCTECERIFCADCNALLHKSAKKRYHSRAPL